MELQIPCSICAEISKESVLRREKTWSRRNPKTALFLTIPTVGKDTKKIQTYIQNQLKEDELTGQLTLEEADPFTGSK